MGAGTSVAATASRGRKQAAETAKRKGVNLFFTGKRYARCRWRTNAECARTNMPNCEALSSPTRAASNDFRHRTLRFRPEARQASQALVCLPGQIAARKQMTPAQIALAWLLAQKPWSAPIC